MMKRVPRAFPIVTWAVSGAIAVGLLDLVLFHGSIAGEPTTPYALTGWPRWIFAAAGGYLAVEAITVHLRSVLPPFGWEHAPIQRAPILARSIGEFWGARWNMIVSVGLRKNVFEPLARRRAAKLGLFASFVVSAILHTFMTLPAAGAIAALEMGAFFVIHGVLVLIETRIGVRRWPVALARVWTLGMFVVTLPLFAEPFLRSLEN
jgi:hypothetical protein